MKLILSFIFVIKLIARTNTSHDIVLIRRSFLFHDKLVFDNKGK